MGEPASGVGRGDGGEGGPGGVSEILVRPGFGTTESVLDLGERVLDGVEVWRVRWQMPEVGTTGLDGSTSLWGMVGAEVVGDDNLAGAQGRREDVADIPSEAVAGHRSVKAERRTHAVEGQCGEHGPVLALVPGCRRVGSLATRGPGMRRGIPEVAPGFIKQNQIGRVHLRRRRPPRCANELVALARRQGLFFRVTPSVVKARLIVDVLTSTPAAWCHHAHCSSNVASACVASRSGSAATNASRFTAGGPGTGFGTRSPRSRFCFSHRLIVGIDTATRQTTSSRGIPLATADTTRHRKSSEYGFTLKA